MTINYLRLIAVALLIVICATSSYQLLYYVAVFFGSIEFLNRQKAFTDLPNVQLFNAIFAVFLVFIVLNRSRHFKMSDFTEGSLNIAEHGFFALIICLKLLLYFHLFSHFSFRLKAIFAALIFNLIGVVNEIFQSWLNQRPLFSFIEDARKDLFINLLGTFLFLIIVALHQLLSQKKNH
jgi:hypothetical protein